MYFFGKNAGEIQMKMSDVFFWIGFLAPKNPGRFLPVNKNFFPFPLDQQEPWAIVLGLVLKCK